jgi:hypothetical protein
MVSKILVHGLLAHCCRPEVGPDIMAGKHEVDQSCSPHDGQEAERDRAGAEDQMHSPKSHPSDLLPPARPHLLNFTPLSKIVPTAGDQAFNT